MKYCLKIVFLFVFITVLIGLTTVSSTAATSKSMSVKSDFENMAEAIYFYNYESGTVLSSKGENKILFPASTTKIMTGLIACEQLIHRTEEFVEITEEMLVGASGVSMGLKVGMRVQIKDLLYGMICGGGNDAALSLAVICCGSIDNFVNEMNLYASSIDMSSTFYKNPTGLDVNGAQTTAFDVFLLSKKAAQNDLYREISSAKNYAFKKDNGEETVIYNRNALISHFTATQYLNENVKGLNAGSTDRGGYVVSAYVEKNGTEYLCIVMGAQKSDGEIYSYKIANDLLSKAFKEFSVRKVISAGEFISERDVQYALSSKADVKVDCILAENVFAYLPQKVDLKKDLEYRVFFHDNILKAPVNKGDVVGGLNIYLDGELIGSSKLISDKSVDGNSFLIFMDLMKDFFLSRYFLIFIVTFIPSIFVFVYFDKMSRRRRKTDYINSKKFFK